MKKHFTIKNNKDEKIWGFFIEKQGYKTIFKIEIGIGMKHRTIFVFEDEYSSNFDKMNWEEFKENINKNNNIFFMKMNYDNFKIYDEETIFFKTKKKSGFKFVNFVS